MDKSFIRRLLTPCPFPTKGNKMEIVAWVIKSQAKDIAWWKIAFIGQLIFWTTLFTTGKVWLGWFPGV